MHSLKRQSTVAAIVLATSIFSTQVGFCRTAGNAVLSIVRDDSGGNPIEKLLCEQRKTTWKADNLEGAVRA
jgi:hypothetical protein